MNDIDKIIKMLEELQSGQKVLNGKVDTLEHLKSDVKGLHGKVDAVELKVEAIHDYQQKAHTEIMGHLVESNEMNGQEKKELEKRIERVEKHVGLPPPK